MNRIVKRISGCLSIILLISIGVNAQTYDEADADVQLLAPTVDADWNKTYNAGGAGEITFAATGATVSERNTCGNKAEGKKETLAFSSSDSHWLDISVPSGNTSTIEHIKFNSVGNSSGSWTEYIWTSTSSPFDANKAKRIEFTLNGYDKACASVEKDLGADVKSVRLYRRVKTSDNGDGTYSLACSSCKTNMGSGQTYALFSMYVWLNKGAEIKSYKVTYNGTQYSGVVGNGTITINVPFATDITGTIIPDEIELSTGATFSAGSNNLTTPVTLSETTPVTYTVEAVGSSKTYNVLINRLPASTENTITKYTYMIGSEERDGKIDEAGKTITVTLPFSYQTKNPAARQSISTTVTYSDLATAGTNDGVSITSGAPFDMNYDASTDITVTAEDVTKTNNYTIKIAYEEASHECQLLTFALAGHDGVIDEANKTVDVYVKSSEFSTSMTPTVAVSTLAEYLPAGPMNFTSPQHMRVIAEDGTTYTEYTITVHRDDEGPTCTIDDPANGSDGAALAGTIKMSFTDNNEFITAGTLDVTITDTGDPSKTQTVKATIGADGKTATAKFKGLEPLSTYKIEIAKDAFKDLAGNEMKSAVSTTFKTADIILHTEKLPWASYFNGSTPEELPAFIQGATYNETVNTMGAAVDELGAYEIRPGGKITIQVEPACTALVKLFALGSCSYSVNGVAGSFTSYDNNGAYVPETGIALTANSTLTIENTDASHTLYVPFISFKADGAWTDNDANCGK